MSTYEEDALSRSMSKRELDMITLTVHGISQVGEFESSLLILLCFTTVWEHLALLVTAYNGGI